MPMNATVPRADLEGLTPKVARLYAEAGPRTFSRDLNQLEKPELIRRAGRGYSARTDVILAFLPPMATPEGQ